MQQLLVTSFDQYEQLITPGGRDICAFPPDFHFLEPWRGGGRAKQISMFFA